MMIVLQLVLYCLLYFLLVKAVAGNDGLRCLYFYPKEYQEEAFRRGLAEKETVARQSKRFMIPFCLIMLAALAAILTFWNRAADFKTALWQAALFLVVMNWFDGIVIDRLWVGRSPVWRIRGMETVDLLCEGKSNRVIAHKDGNFVDFDIDEALAMKKSVDEYMYDISKSLV